MPDKRSRLLYLSLGLLAAVMLLPLLLMPFNSDNDTYQSMALALARGKGLPYLGSWDQNFPGIVFYHLLAIKLFGVSEVAFRIVDLINQVAIALIAFAITRRYVTLEAAWLVVPLSVILYLGAGFWVMGQRDTFAATWLLLALHLTLKHENSTKHLLLIAACVAAATFIRPTLILFSALVIVNASGWRQALRDTFVFSASLIVALILLLLPWILTEGGMREFFTATILFNKEVYGPTPDRLASPFFIFTIFTPFFLASLFSLAMSLVLSKLRQFGIATLIYLTCGFVGIMVMGKYHVYHYAIIFPILAILFCLALGTVLPKWRLAASLIIMMGVGLYYYPKQAVAQFVKGGMTRRAYERILNNIASYPELGHEQETAVIHYLKSRGAQEHDVEFFLLWPGMRWRSGFESDTRFTTTFCLSMEGPHGLTKYQKQWREEVRTSLLTHKPSYIVSAIGPKHVFMFSRISSDSLLHSAEGIRDIMAYNYHLDTAIAGFRVYRSNEAH